MSGSTIARERLAWTAAVAVLSTSLAWLGIINLVLFVTAHETRFAAALLVAKALIRAGWAVASDAWPLPFAVLIASSLILVVAGAAARRIVSERSAP
jgi:hypothetical protein